MNLFLCLIFSGKNGGIYKRVKKKGILVFILYVVTNEQSSCGPMLLPQYQSMFHLGLLPLLLSSDLGFVIIVVMIVIIRFKGLDDQAVFWHVIRRSTDPPVYPLGKCRHVQDGEKLNVPIPPVGKSITVVPMTGGGESSPLITCVLDSCVFSSGMISRLYVPEYTYGMYFLYFFYYHFHCCSPMYSLFSALFWMFVCV